MPQEKTLNERAALHFNDNLKRAEEGYFFGPDRIDEFINESIKDVRLMKKRGKEYVYNCPASFDIETTSFYAQTEYGPEKRAILYIWQFGLNGNVLIGRSWADFYRLCERLTALLGLSAGQKHLIVYVHNLAFEMGFLQFRFEWENVFSIAPRRPIYATTKTGIQFRCSYLLSGYGLDLIGKNLLKYKVRKLSGEEFDYSLVRNEKTVLSPLELQYCINDVLVVMAYIQEKIEQDGGIIRIQYTKTGYVRKLVRDKCLYAGEQHHNSKIKKGIGRQFERYHNMIKHLTLTPDEYLQAKRAFQGGYTHADGFAVGREYFNVDSYDFTSSYPAVMIAEKYPMTRGELYTPTSYEDFLNQQRWFCCMYDIEFTNIRATFVYDHYISRSRCVEAINPVTDNGRIVSADRILLTITEQDFDIIKRTYEYDNVTIYNFRRYRRNYLPKEYIETILELYEVKTRLKGLTSDDGSIERMYLNGKENLNALYGMSVMDICRPEIIFDGQEWRTEEPNIDEMLQQYNTSKTRFNSYLWGVWVTAYARHNLWTAILNIGPDYLYSDTDSVKIINGEAHKEYFEQYNTEIVAALNDCCIYYNIDPERTRPKNSKGKVKQLGIWDYEGRYKRFKTLGAKRYLTEDDSGIHLTVAGLGKTTAAEYLLYHYKTSDAVFKAFSDDLEIPAEYERDGAIKSATGKNTHTYIDGEYSGRITDYQGHNVAYNEKSGIHLEPAAYGLSLADEYVSYLFDIGVMTME